MVHCPATSPAYGGSTPLVMTVHDLLWLSLPQYFTTPVRAYHRMCLPAIRRAAAVLTDCEYTRGQLVELVGVPAERVHVAPLGVDPRFAPRDVDRDRLRERFGIPGRYVLAVATREPRKNLGALLRAFERLASRVDDVQLVLVGGRGWRSAELERTLGGRRRSRHGHRLRLRRGARRAVRGRDLLRVPVVRGRVRPPGSGGDGQRCAGRDERSHLAARGRRRRRALDRPRRRRTRSRTRSSPAHARRSWPPTSLAAASPAARGSRGRRARWRPVPRTTRQNGRRDHEPKQPPFLAGAEAPRLGGPDAHPRVLPPQTLGSWLDPGCRLWQCEVPRRVRPGHLAGHAGGPRHRPQRVSVSASRTARSTRSSART